MAEFKHPKCPGCEGISTLYGHPYGLQIGSHEKGKNISVDAGVVLVMCGECGGVVGAYHKNEAQQ